MSILDQIHRYEAPYERGSAEEAEYCQDLMRLSVQLTSMLIERVPWVAEIFEDKLRGDINNGSNMRG